VTCCNALEILLVAGSAKSAGPISWFRRTLIASISCGFNRFRYEAMLQFKAQVAPQWNRET